MEKGARFGRHLHESNGGCKWNNGWANQNFMRSSFSEYSLFRLCIKLATSIRLWLAEEGWMKLTSKTILAFLVISCADFSIAHFHVKPKFEQIKSKRISNVINVGSTLPIKSTACGIWMKQGSILSSSDWMPVKCCYLFHPRLPKHFECESTAREFIAADLFESVRTNDSILVRIEVEVFSGILASAMDSGDGIDNCCEQKIF